MVCMRSMGSVPVIGSVARRGFTRRSRGAGARVSPASTRCSRSCALRGSGCSGLSNKTPLRFLAAGYACQRTVKRLGRARVARFLYRHSRGRWGEEEAEALLGAAAETLTHWADDLGDGRGRR